MKSKHKKAIVCLINSTEAVLNAMEKSKIDPDKVASRPEFKILVHLLKTIIDNEFLIKGNNINKIDILFKKIEKK